MKADFSHFKNLRWYQWPLYILLLPFALVILAPLGILALLSIPYFAIFPDRHPHVVDISGSPRQQQLLASWRSKYQQLGIVGRVGVALRGGRRRRRVTVYEIKQPNQRPDRTRLDAARKSGSSPRA